MNRNTRFFSKEDRVRPGACFKRVHSSHWAKNCTLPHSPLGPTKTMVGWILEANGPPLPCQGRSLSQVPLLQENLSDLLWDAGTQHLYQDYHGGGQVNYPDQWVRQPFLMIWMPLGPYFLFTLVKLILTRVSSIKTLPNLGSVTCQLKSVLGIKVRPCVFLELTGFLVT